MQSPYPLELFGERDRRRSRGVPERALQRGAQVAERGLHLKRTARLGLGVQQLLTRQRERYAEQALHDALVDLAGEIDPLLQLSRCSS